MTINQIGSDDSLGHIVRVVKAISTSAAAGSTIIPASGGEPKKTRCKTFTAEIIDRVYIDSVTRDLVPTGESVTVVNEFPDAMSSGEEITIAELADGEWTILVWFCEPEDE